DLLREVEQRASVVFRSIDGLREPEPASPVALAPGEELPIQTQSVSPEMRAALERLRAAVADSDLTGCAEVVQQIRPGSLPANLRPQAVRLQQLIDDYEFDEAGRIVEQMLDALPRETSA